MFTAAPSQPQFATSQLVAADFNGDGKVDLATSGGTGNTVAVLLGNGDGTFAAPSTLPTDPNFVPGGLVVGDFNGDGKSDLAVAAGANVSAGETVSIFAGNGDGTFADRVDVPLVAGSLTTLAAADLTGNGSSDLAVFGSVFLGHLTITTATADYVLPIGADVIEAEYPGDANNAPSSSINASVVVPPVPYSLTITPFAVSAGTSGSNIFTVTSAPSFQGTLNLSCSISVAQNLANPPACSVPATVTLSAANGRLYLIYEITTQATTAAGQYSITITATDPVGGTTASSSAAVSVTGPQNYQLSNSGATIASPGASGSSTITVSPTGGFTGQVALSCALTGGPVGGVSPPTCSIPSQVSVAGSPVTTTLTVNTQPGTIPGAYTVTVTGASAGSASTTTSLNFNVPAPAPSFSLSSTAVSIPTPGPRATSTITISPGGGFTGNVSLSCAITGGPAGAVDAPTCSVTTPPPITGATAVTATLAIGTTAASSAAHGYSVARSQPPPRVPAIGGSLVAIASLLLFGLPISRRRMMPPLALLLIAILVGTAAGCGGKNAATPPANPGTTPGAYIVTVTGSSGTITATTAVTVTVN